MVHSDPDFQNQPSSPADLPHYADSLSPAEPAFPLPPLAPNVPTDRRSVGRAAEDLSDDDIETWLETLRKTDRSLNNLMALEIWAIAATMDEQIPGFWNRFMINRRTAMEEFLQQRRQERGEE
jgi:hypothetical protein